MVDDDPALLKSLMPQGYKARPEQVILFRISAWDTNCPQHIPQKFDAADVAAALASRDARIAELEAELAALKGQLWRLFDAINAVQAACRSGAQAKSG